MTEWQPIVVSNASDFRELFDGVEIASDGSVIMDNSVDIYRHSRHAYFVVPVREEKRIPLAAAIVCHLKDRLARCSLIGMTIHYGDKFSLHCDAETGVCTFSGKTKPRADEFAKVRVLFDGEKRETEI